jgi:YidC/Oxa1 family membrane protein insertase
MMMDKRTIWIVLGCLVALVAWQKLVDVMFPPKPKRPRPVTEAVSTNVEPVHAEAPLEKAVEAIKEPVAEPDQPRSPEQTAMLSNEFVRVEFTSWGGGIRQVELLKHKANGHGNVILNGPEVVPALTLKGIPGAGAEAGFELQRPDDKTVVMRTRARGGDAITKTFSLGDGYLLTGRVAIIESGGSTMATQNVEMVVGTATIANPKELPTYLGVDWLVGSKYQDRNLNVIRKNAAKGQNREATAAMWVAVKSQFFAMILAPSTNATAVAYEAVELSRPEGWKSKEPPHGLSAAVQMRSTSIAEGTMTFEFTYYAGPKEYDRLVALGNGQEEVMQFGFWGVISVVLLKSMNFFHRIIPNYGVAIILITIIIKIIFWPIQAKSIRSMKEMQKFQPLMAKLKEKYKDDPQRMNQEMMKLYKEHKVNPFSGCLPMVVQIPVFFALFAMLRSAIELRGARFLWIKDLSQPDTILALGGLPLNPLPLLMVGSMIWQQKITPTTADPQQAKMMMFMPLMMLVFFYNASSGLALYWTVQQFLSIAQQYWSMRQTGQPSPVAGPQTAGKMK